MAVLKLQPSANPVSPVDVAIGRQVHELLWTRGIRQEPVYTAMGISRSALTKKMRGEIRWYAEDLVIVASLLGVPPGDLLPRLDSNQQPSDYARYCLDSGQTSTTPLAPNGFGAQTCTPASRWLHLSRATRPALVDGLRGYGGLP